MYLCSFINWLTNQRSPFELGWSGLLASCEVHDEERQGCIDLTEIYEAFNHLDFVDVTLAKTIVTEIDNSNY